MSDKNFDPGMKDTCELKEAWADGKKLYYIEDIPGLLEQITCLNKQLAKANERVAELDEIADTAFKYNHSSAECIRAWSKLQQLRKEQASE